MTVTIGADIPERGLAVAAIGLGLPPTTSKSGIIRAALAILAGKSHAEAIRYVTPSKDRNLVSGKGFNITAKVPEDLLLEAEAALPDNTNRAYAVRVGLAMAAGYDRPEAEEWAKMNHGPKPKPRA